MADTKISALTAKDTPVAADITNILDSAAANADKKITLGNIPLTGNIELKALATGILKNTTTTGTPSIAVSGTDYLAPAWAYAGLTNLAYVGLTIAGVAGESLSPGDTTYLKAADSRWWKTDASAAATMSNHPALAVTTAAAGGDAVTLLILGYFRKDALSFTTNGAPIYFSETAGEMTLTPPADDGDQVQVAGKVTDVDNIIEWNPDKSVIEIGPTNADTITAANEAADTTCFPIFVTAATGDLAPKTNAGLAFNSSTGMLTATGLTGPLTGNADTATKWGAYAAISGPSEARTYTLPDATTTILTATSLDISLADGEYTGVTRTLVAFNDIDIGELVSFKLDTTLKFQLCDVSEDLAAVGIATQTVVANGSNTVKCLMSGRLRTTGLPTLTIGAPVYRHVSTDGLVQVAAPAVTGNKLQMIGFGDVDGDTIYFDPSKDVFTVA